MMPSIEQIFNGMADAFNAKAAAGVDAVIQFRVTGDGGGDWNVTIKDQQCQVQKGLAANPRVTLTANASDTADILLGKLDGTKAFFSGRLKISGDIGFASRITSLFS
ncbi:MAG: SCP2 sterol-binding domain-containing protein [Anaerolineae bacterium]|jgi:putative sterol carrier protein|nr:SCP2 sterol-binding domain-containing protein [Anaerolineae bacterium]